MGSILCSDLLYLFLFTIHLEERSLNVVPILTELLIIVKFNKRKATILSKVSSSETMQSRDHQNRSIHRQKNLSWEKRRRRWRLAMTFIMRIAILRAGAFTNWAPPEARRGSLPARFWPGTLQAAPGQWRTGRVPGPSPGRLRRLLAVD